MSRFEERLVKWSPRITLILSATVVVLAGVAVYILTQYQPKTACERDPSSRACQKIKVESDKERNVRSACVILHKAGYKCPVGDVRQRIEKRKDTRDGGETTVRPSSQPDPDPSGGPAATEPPPPSGDNGDSSPPGDQPGPVGPPPAPTPDPPSPPSPDPPRAPDPPSPPASPPTLGDQVGGAAGETIDGATGTVCQLTNALGVCIR